MCVRERERETHRERDRDRDSSNEFFLEAMAMIILETTVQLL